MSFVNDSLLTTLCLQYEARQIAAAVVFLSYSFMGLPPVETVFLDVDDTVVSGEILRYHLNRLIPRAIKDLADLFVLLGGQ